MPPRRRSSVAPPTFPRLDRRRLVGAAATALAGVVVGTRGSAGAVTDDAEEQVFYHFPFLVDPTSFDFNADPDCGAEDTTFAGLVSLDENLEVVPDWAERWETNADGSVYTFFLRRDNRGWSNGDPVTSHDFVWSWTRLLDPATLHLYAFYLYDVKRAEAFNTGQPYRHPGDPLDGVVPGAADLGLRAIDDWTFEVTLEAPTLAFPFRIAWKIGLPAHRPSVETYGDEWAKGTVPLVSNGPFKLIRWDHGAGFELARNDAYWDAEAINLTRVVCPIVHSPQVNGVNWCTGYDAPLRVYETGQGDRQLDWAMVSFCEIDRFRADPDLAAQLRPVLFTGLWMLLPSNGVPPFDQWEVRRAVSHALDRDRLAGVDLRGMGIPAQVMMPPRVPGHFEDDAIAAIQRFDPELALSMLRGTPFEGGRNWPEITMLLRDADQPISDALAAGVVAQLGEHLGMDVAIQTVPLPLFNQTLALNKSPLVLIRWWTDYLDPDNSYGDMFYSRVSGPRRQAWSNDGFDDLVLAGHSEVDPEKRLNIYKEAERIIQEDVGYVPLVYRVDWYAFKPWVRGLPVDRHGYSVTDDGLWYSRMLTSLSITGRPADR